MTKKKRPKVKQEKVYPKEDLHMFYLAHVAISTLVDMSFDDRFETEQLRKKFLQSCANYLNIAAKGLRLDTKTGDWVVDMRGNGALLSIKIDLHGINQEQEQTQVGKIARTQLLEKLGANPATCGDVKFEITTSLIKELRWSSTFVTSTEASEAEIQSAFNRASVVAHCECDHMRGVGSAGSDTSFPRWQLYHSYTYQCLLEKLGKTPRVLGLTQRSMR